MKIAFISADPRRKMSAALTRLFTGSATYHVAWVDEERGRMVDMHLIRRQRNWPHYDPANVKLVESPVPVSWEYLEQQLLVDDNTYGIFDYVMFALRPIYHLLGLSTRNKGGVICSEMVYNDLVANGWPHRYREVPSPADLERVLL